MKQKTKRVLLFSDLHCGHRMGLVPPQWHDSGSVGDVQRELWESATEIVKSIGSVDAAVCVGDAVDGAGRRSGGVELIRPAPADQHVVGVAELQLQIAEESCRALMEHARTRHFVIGTDYHVSNDGLLVEEALARRFGTHAHAEFSLDPFEDGSALVHLKHHVGSSGAPHTAFTGPQMAQLWQSVRALDNGRQSPVLVVRGHVHRFSYGWTAHGRSLTLPCLQVRSRFGDLRMDRPPDLGLVVAEIASDRSVKIEFYRIKIGGNSHRVVSL